MLLWRMSGVKNQAGRWKQEGKGKLSGSQSQTEWEFPGSYSWHTRTSALWLYKYIQMNLSTFQEMGWLFSPYCDILKGLNIVEKLIMNRFSNNEVGDPLIEHAFRGQVEREEQNGANGLSYHMHRLQCVAVIDQCCLCGFTLWPPSLAPSTVSHLCVHHVLLPPPSSSPFLSSPMYLKTFCPHSHLMRLRTLLLTSQKYRLRSRPFPRGVL